MNVLASMIAMLAVLVMPEGKKILPSDSAFESALRAETASARSQGPKTARIRSCRSDMDREEGVVMFEKDVFVEYSNDYTMNADRLFVIFKGTNELSRIVASGSVVITNETRTGDCSLAVFRNLERRIELYGEQGKPARLVERSGDRGAVAGAKITYWMDNEQVEVIDPEISLEEKDVR